MSIGHWIACREPLLLMQPSTCHLQRTKQRQTAKRLSFPLKCQNVNKKHQNLLNRSPHHLKPPVRRTLSNRQFRCCEWKSIFLKESQWQI